LRHRQTKGAATDRFNLRGGKPVLYSTCLLTHPESPGFRKLNPGYLLA